MLLRNSLYYIVESRETESESREAEYRVRFDAFHPIFAGHFPGHPVVPGACLIQIAEELLATHLGQKVRFTSVRNLKFRQPVLPDQEVTITILLAKEQNVKCQLSIINSLSASFTATYMCLDSDV